MKQLVIIMHNGNRYEVVDDAEVIASIIDRHHFEDEYYWLKTVCKDGKCVRFMPNNISEYYVEDIEVLNETLLLKTLSKIQITKDDFVYISNCERERLCKVEPCGYAKSYGKDLFKGTCFYPVYKVTCNDEYYVRVIN